VRNVFLASSSLLHLALLEGGRARGVVVLWYKEERKRRRRALLRSEHFTVDHDAQRDDRLVVHSYAPGRCHVPRLQYNCYTKTFFVVLRVGRTDFLTAAVFLFLHSVLYLTPLAGRCLLCLFLIESAIGARGISFVCHCRNL